MDSVATREMQCGIYGDKRVHILEAMGEMQSDIIALTSCCKKTIF